MRALLLALAVVLLAFGLHGAPRGLHRAAWVPGEPLPEAGYGTRASQARRWIRLEVPAGETLRDFLTRYRLAGRTFVCRRDCRGATFPAANCAGFHGRLWVAVGEPPPSQDPACEGAQ